VNRCLQVLAQVPAATSTGGQAPAGGEAPPGRGEELKQVYKQDLALERQLRKQNIIQGVDGSYLRARPYGAGGVELVPVDASQLESMRTM